MDTPLPQEPFGASVSQPQATSPPAAIAPPVYRDRSTGLVAFGIIQIVLGAFSLLLIPLLLLGVLMSRRTTGALPPGNYVLTVMTYLLTAIVLVTLGVGSIRARRWAWALTLVSSWIWLVAGILMTVLLTATLPATFMTAMRTAAASRANAPPIAKGVIAVILTFIIAMGAIFLVVLPIIFLIFYRQKDVEETCRHRDPLERWTDRCPLPVLAASLIFAWGAVHCVGMSLATPLLPFFGRYLTGPRASIGLLLLAALDAFLAYSVFRLQRQGWWIGLAGMALGLTSAAVTFRRADLLQAYAKMGWSQGQLQMMSANPGFHSGVYLYLGLGFSVIFLGYMIWIKRYFAAPAVAGSAGTEPSYPTPLA